MASKAMASAYGRWRSVVITTRFDEERQAMFKEFRKLRVEGTAKVKAALALLLCNAASRTALLKRHSAQNVSRLFFHWLR